MEWHNEVAAELPPANEDEPKSLRRDILDELTDHLTCSAQRERIQEDDEETVRQTILARFGDPARVARRLWFDAMKGKLMLQKLTAAFAAVAALAAIVVCLLLWSAVNGAAGAFNLAVEQSRKDRERADRQLREERERANQANAALLTKLETIATEAQKNSFRSLEWNLLKFKMLLGKDGERPAVGYRIRLTGSPYSTKDGESITKRSKEDGVVDFGRVRPGRYHVTVSTPWNASTHLSIHITPGTEVEKTIRCPEMSGVDADVELAIDLPEDLAKRKCRVVVLISGARHLIGHQTWMAPDFDRTHFESSPSGMRRVIGWRAFPYGKPNATTGFLGMTQSTDVSSHPMAPSAPSTFGWRTRTYQIEFAAMLLPKKETKEIRNSGAGKPMSRGDAFYVVDAISYVDRHFANGLLGEKYPTFEPQASKKNIWTITLPPKLLANARERLKRYDAQKRAPEKARPGGVNNEVTGKAKHRAPFSVRFNRS